VHLLLSLPLFTVIVGVDPRWLHTSLNQTHEKLFPRTGNRSSSTTTNDYLEKIFQLTYSLPAMTETGYSQLVNATLESVLAPTTSAVARSTAAPPADLADIVQTTQALTLTAAEKSVISQIAPLLARTPRSTKRFLSMYLVIRARGFAEHDSSRERIDETSNGLLLLVALMLKVPDVVPQLILDPDETLTFSSWLERNGGIDGAEVPTLALDDNDLASLRRLRNASDALFDVALPDVIAWRDIAGPYVNVHFRSLGDQAGDSA
jgi:hypothetical protein